MRQIVEFNSTRDDDIPGYKKILDYKGHSYFIKTKDNAISNYWTTARDEANAIGGYLVVLNDDAENTLVWQAVRAYSTQRNYWIGHYQDTKKSILHGAFRCLDNCRIPFYCKLHMAGE